MFRFIPLLAALFLVGCSTVNMQMTRAKMSEIQLPLTTLDDGAAFSWSLDAMTHGEVKIVRTFSKGTQVCRLVEEREIIDSKQGEAVSTYCLTRSGEWQ